MTECGPRACKSFGVAGDGKACGSTLGGSASPSSLYSCKASGAAWKTTREVVCPAGCHALSPGHAYCDGDPCGQIMQQQTASYCGGALGGPDNPNAAVGSLYTCSGGVTQSVMKCPNGCTVTKCN